MAQDDGHSLVLLVQAGGAAFGVDLLSIKTMAGADWDPQAASPDALHVSLAGLLGLAAKPATRTLVVDTPQGPVGFGIDSVDSGTAIQAQVLAIPSLLRKWMTVDCLRGFIENPTWPGLIRVLDVKRLACWARDRRLRSDPTDGGSGAGD
jgi:hypothetical protein